MQPWSMTVDTILTHAATAHGARAVVSRDLAGVIHVSDYTALHARARQVSAAIAGLGINRGDRVGSLMWNDLDHVAAWFGTMAIGAVLHTLNPRLGAERVGWIAEHGGDRLIVCSKDMVPLLADAVTMLGGVDRVLVTDAADVTSNIGGIPMETLDRAIARSTSSPSWGDFEENSAAGLCYTSGTTGPPKGVLYSHRSNMLHALTVNQPGAFGIGPADVVLAIVPMFHANGWALPFIAPMVGAELVLPGRHLDPTSLVQLIRLRGVTFAAGVPTIWEDLLCHLDKTGIEIPSLRRVVIGGSAPSADLVRRLDARGIVVAQAWGMTELSPVGALSWGRGSDATTRITEVLRQGRPMFPVSAEIIDDTGSTGAHDDVAAGRLVVRGPNVVDTYFRGTASSTDSDGWFDTGDIAAIDTTGSIRLVDRAKDVIKSGGEWISSIELEGLAMTHPRVSRAAVIGIPDPRWGERPLLVIEAEAPRPELDEVVELMRPAVPRWWLPTQIAYLEIPLGATGKIDKLALRRALLCTDGSSDAAVGEAL